LTLLCKASAHVLNGVDGGFAHSCLDDARHLSSAKPHERSPELIATFGLERPMTSLGQFELRK